MSFVPFATRAQLERQIESAVQLRAESLGSRTIWSDVWRAIAGALRLPRAGDQRLRRADLSSA